MTATFAAVLGLTLAQPPAPQPDYWPLKGRTIDLPVEYKSDRKGIAQIQLYASADKGQTWPLVATALPDKTEFKYTVPKDGAYWFHIVIVDRNGKKDPPNLTSEPPAQKVLVDTVPPLVEYRTSRRTGEEIVVEWDVRDEFPNDAATRVQFRRADGPPDEWYAVTLPTNHKNGVRFKSGTTGPVAVKVTAVDLVGNTGESVRELPAAGAAPVGAPPATSTSLSAPTIPAPGPLAPPPGGAPIAPPEPLAPAGPAPVAPLAPPAGLAPQPPTVVTPPPAAPMVVTPAPAGPLVTTPPAPPAPMVAPAAPGAVPTFDPRTATAPTPISAQQPAAAPGVELSRGQVVPSLTFDLNYQVDQRGPSGIQRVDLYATKDDGRTWVWWSKHAGNDPTIRVNLGIPSNTQPEGQYGFRLVPVSGAGLSDGIPVPGDAPDIRVVVDVTAPVVRIFPPAADPADPTVLILQWEATDRNFGDDPITLEWSDGPTGPWRPVVGAADGPVVQAGVAGPVSAARRVANTGRYAWRVPAGLPPRVYLKVTARDAAGNPTEQVTREPLLIDLTKPRARITGVGATVGRN